MINFATAIAWVKSLEEVTPAALRLYNEVKALFGPNDQASLQAALEEIQTRNDADHERRQAE